MQQDQRIGLALAVLLLGAAGAFFFRNDAKPAGSSPRLKSSRELDARIAEKSISPYLESADEDHETPGTSARKVSDRNDGSLPSLFPPDFFTDEEPSKSTSDGDVQDLAPIPFPDSNRKESVGNSDRTTTKPLESGDRIHVVQKGETLSSIAAKELGSSGRFHELFEANRDQLNDANDVRVGMSLRIPSRRTSRTYAPAPKKNNSAPPLLPSDNDQVGELPPINVDPGNQTPRTGDSSPAKKKFEPVKRPPLGVKGMGTQSSEAEPPAKPTRKLSQVPPKDGKVAR